MFEEKEEGRGLSEELRKITSKTGKKYYISQPQLIPEGELIRKYLIIAYPPDSDTDDISIFLKCKLTLLGLKENSETRKKKMEETFSLAVMQELFYDKLRGTIEFELDDKENNPLGFKYVKKTQPDSPKEIDFKYNDNINFKTDFRRTVRLEILKVLYSCGTGVDLEYLSKNVFFNGDDIYRERQWLLDGGYIKHAESFPGIDSVEITEKGIEYREELLSKLRPEITGSTALTKKLKEQEESFESPDLSFIDDSQLREILERDYLEIQRSLVSNCWKAAMVLCGGCLEGVLYDALRRDESKTRSSSKAQKEPLEKWRLETLIDVAADLGLLSITAEKFSDGIREFRNLIHPLREIKEKGRYKVDGHEARIAFEVLQSVIRDLREKFSSS